MNLASFFGIILLITVPLIVFGSSTKTPEAARTEAARLHAEGLMHFNNGDFKMAIKLWLRELAINPDSASALNDIGISYTKLDIPAKALPYHLEALRIDPSYGHAHYSLGQAYFALERYQNAIKAFLRAIQLKYKPMDAYYKLGEIAQRINKPDDGITYFAEAAKANPSAAWVHYYLGQSYLEIGKLDEAKRAFKTEVALGNGPVEQARLEILRIEAKQKPDDPIAIFALGCALESRISSEAMKAFQECIRLVPDFADAYYHLGAIYLKNRDLPRAQELYLQAMKISGKHEDAALGLAEIRRLQDESDFEPLLLDFSLPQDFMVGFDNTIVYDLSYFPLRKLAKGERITVASVHKKKVKLDACQYSWFFVQKDKPALVRIQDVIPLSAIDHPVLLSPNKKVQIIRSIGDIERNIYDEQYHPGQYLWLKSKSGTLIFLGSYNHYFGDEIPVFISPDEKYIMLDVFTKVFTIDGTAIWARQEEWEYKNIETYQFSSPTWHENVLFIRGLDDDDAVYALDLKDKKLRLFLDIPDGEKIENGGDGIAKWPPVQIQNGNVIVKFNRLDPQAGDDETRCMVISVEADMNGKIIRKSIARSNDSGNCW